MRKHLRETFDTISILNLHGDTRTGDPSSGQNENVFDIMQGVSIAIMRASKSVDRSDLAAVHYHELLGKRRDKYNSLFHLRVNDDSFEELDCHEPLHRFLPSSNPYSDRYFEGFPTSSLFRKLSSGIQTKQDDLCISESETELAKRLDDFRSMDEAALREEYGIPKDSGGWKMNLAIADVKYQEGKIVPFLYRPFDFRNVYYSGKTSGFVARPRRDIMQHVVGRDNICLIVNRQNVRDHFSHVGVTNVACCHGTFYLGNRGQDYCCPLYLYPKDEYDVAHDREVNFDSKLYERLQELATHPMHGTPDEVAAFDYIYGVLHCPAYRETYAEFLKIDFPRIPWPSSPETFWDVSAKGTELRRLHLMEPDAIGETPFPFMGDGDNVVDKIVFDDGKVWINKTQHFDNAPEVSWGLFIGGYQPAQKWLKDRKGRALSFSDVKHYQRILKILSETDRIMATINMELA